MKTPVAYYRKLYRRIVRLPLDCTSLQILIGKVRHEFTLAKNVPTNSVVDRKAYDKFSTLLDDLLIEEKYRQLGRLLDLVYLQPVEPWVVDFQNTKYNAFKSTWPQVHLLREFGGEKHIALYEKELLRLEPEKEDFLIMKELGLKLGLEKPLTPIRKIRFNRDLTPLVKHAKELYDFAKANATRLFDLKVKPFEVCYEPNKFGLPSSIASREYRLRTTITYVKELLASLRPIKESDLRHLIAVATYTGPDNEIYSLNPRFARYMERKRETESVSPYVKKYLRQKQLIPNDRNLRSYYREYVLRKFYKNGNGKLCMSPMVNYYD